MDLNIKIYSGLEPSARYCRSVGFQTCRVADFPGGRESNASVSRRVGKLAIQQTRKSALQPAPEIRGSSMTFRLITFSQELRAQTDFSEDATNRNSRMKSLNRTTATSPSPPDVGGRRGPGRGGFGFAGLPLSPALSPLVPRGESETERGGPRPRVPNPVVLDDELSAFLRSVWFWFAGTIPKI